MPTVVFIHGNRTDADEAVVKGWYAYESIQAETADRPFRYVIWSWPAERVCRRNKVDVQLKADYSDVESYYLAKWLDRLRPGVKVSLVGHSFGPRIITGALHLLAGGEVAGRNMSAEHRGGVVGRKAKPHPRGSAGRRRRRRLACAGRTVTIRPFRCSIKCSSPATAATGFCGGIRECTAAAARRPWDVSAPAASPTRRTSRSSTSACNGRQASRLAVLLLGIQCRKSMAAVHVSRRRAGAALVLCQPWFD